MTLVLLPLDRCAKTCLGLLVIGKKTSTYTLNYVETLKVGKKTYKTTDL